MYSPRGSSGGSGGGSARTSTVTHFNEISTVNRKIAPPHPEFITKKDSYSNYLPLKQGRHLARYPQISNIELP